MSQYKIEKDVPFVGARVHNRYPLSDMKVGDSFLVPDGTAKTTSVRSAVSMYKARHPGTDFMTKEESDGLRVWRTA